jgi:uracil-DNA glycosylase
LTNTRGTGYRSVGSLSRRVVCCKLCPRLVEYRESVVPRAAYAGQEYWRKPVPGFGDIEGRVMVLGIAPAQHGGCRTGRPFTGDESGRFLVKALYQAGFANKPVSEGRDDGLRYDDCYLTAAVKCAPPADRPTRQEFLNCSQYLDAEVELMKNLRSVVTLGGLSFNAWLDHLARVGERPSGLVFAHGAAYEAGGVRLYASYHPSPRNTNTGRLTLPMLTRVLRRVKRDLGEVQSPRPTGTWALRLV